MRQNGNKNYPTREQNYNYLSNQQKYNQDM